MRWPSKESTNFVTANKKIQNQKLENIMKGYLQKKNLKL